MFKNPIVILFALVCVLISLLLLVDRDRCKYYGILKNKQTEYSLRLGCVIKKDGKWYMEEEYKYKEGLNEIGKSK